MVFKSTDDGRNWRAINNGLIGKYFVTLQIDPLTPTTLYVGSLANLRLKARMVVRIGMRSTLA